MSRCKTCAKREEEARSRRKAALRAELMAGRAPMAREEILDEAIRALKPLWPGTIRYIRKYGMEKERLHTLFPAFVGEVSAEFRRRAEGAAP